MGQFTKQAEDLKTKVLAFILAKLKEAGKAADSRIEFAKKENERWTSYDHLPYIELWGNDETFHGMAYVVAIEISSYNDTMSAETVTIGPSYSVDYVDLETASVDTICEIADLLQ